MRKSKTPSQFLLPHIFQSWSQSLLSDKKTPCRCLKSGRRVKTTWMANFSPHKSRHPNHFVIVTFAWQHWYHHCLRFHGPKSWASLHSRDAIESISVYQMSVGTISWQVGPGQIINHHADADWCISFHCVDGMIHISVIHSFYKKVWMIDKTRVSSKKFAILPDCLVPDFFTNHTTATLLISKDVCDQNQRIKPSAAVTTDMLTSYCGFKPPTPIA